MLTSAEWAPTPELRWHFNITHYEWTTKYEPRGTRTLQQKWTRQSTGDGTVDDEWWRDVPTHETSVENPMHYA